MLQAVAEISTGQQVQQSSQGKEKKPNPTKRIELSVTADRSSDTASQVQSVMIQLYNSICTDRQDNLSYNCL